MEQISNTKMSPAQLVAELREVGLPDLRDFLALLFENFTSTNDWKEAPEDWRDSCDVYYLELQRALELMEKIELDTND